jgi:hypothetical protein
MISVGRSWQQADFGMISVGKSWQQADFGMISVGKSWQQADYGMMSALPTFFVENCRVRLYLFCIFQVKIFFSIKF